MQVAAEQTTNKARMDHADIGYWRAYAMRVASASGLKSDDAEDAAQEALIDLMKAWDRCGDERDPKPYRNRVVGNAVRMFLRAKKPLDSLIEADEPQAPDAYEAIDRALVASADLAAVSAELAALCPYQREVIKLIADGLTTAEIATQLSRSYYSVESARRNARRRIAGQV